MYFDNLTTIDFLSMSNGYALSSLIENNFKDDTLYKLEIKENYFASPIELITLTSSYFSNENIKYPDNALKIELKKGTYRISYSNGCIFNNTTKKLNDCIKSSKGPLIFNDINLTNDELNSLNNENYREIIDAHKNELINNVIDIKISSASKFHIWVDSNDVIGEITLKINKLETKENEIEPIEKIFDKSTIPFLNLKIDTMYKIGLSELKLNEIVKPTPKYPVGTYQIVLNDELKSDTSSAELSNLLNLDKQKFRFINNSEKLASLYNITIPKDVDPLQFYFMLGKIEIIVFFDFNNDKFYVYPDSYIECFMNLFLPKSEMSIIESNSEFLKIKIIEYKHIAYNFKQQDEILNNLNKWTGVDINDIKIDKYGLYYYGYTYNLNDSFISDIIGNHIDIDSYFTYIKLDITCKVYDNVANKVELEDTLLDYNVVDYQLIENQKVGGLWEVINEIPSEFNYINWSQPTDWKNTDEENILESFINGKGFIKITKQHFMNITGVNIENIKFGNLTDEQFKMLKLNDPLISPFNRFQYWINLTI